MDLKVILLLTCSLVIIEKVNGLEEERILLRLSQIESGLESCENKNNENSAMIEKNVGILNETKDTLEDHTDALNKANNEITILKEDVQVLQKFAKVGTSCSQLASFGFEISDTYFLDYDGLGQGHSPFKVFCRMPENIAQVGEEVIHEVEHCQTSYCFEKLLNYEAPNDQLTKLLEASPSCSQTITLDCFLSPVKVQFFKFHKLWLNRL